MASGRGQGESWAGWGGWHGYAKDWHYLGGHPQGDSRQPTEKNHRSGWLESLNVTIP